MMIRSFLSVGQGAFYLEQFKFQDKNVNVIYDCGSLTDVHIVEQEIKSNYDKNEVIAAVFISHFDRDHINGLPFLLKYCQVSKIFVPLITEDCKKLILLEDLLTHGVSTPDFFTTFINNPYQAFDMIDLNDRPALYQIQEVGIDSIQHNDNARYIPSGTNVAEDIFTPANCSQMNWIYIPFNFRETTRLQQLKDALQNRLGKAYSCEELSDLIKKVRKY